VRISEREANLAERLLEGASFGDACDAAHTPDGSSLDEIAVEAARLLVDACRRGLVVRVA
jgi:hypothetical protein